MRPEPTRSQFASELDCLRARDKWNTERIEELEGITYAVLYLQTRTGYTAEAKAAEARKAIQILGLTPLQWEEVSAHIDHPMRHWDRSCPECQREVQENNTIPDQAYATWHKDPKGPVSTGPNEPVLYQARLRPTWTDGIGWTEWETCTKEQHDEYVRVPLLHDWQYETRKLYPKPLDQIVQFVSLKEKELQDKVAQLSKELKEIDAAPCPRCETQARDCEAQHGDLLRCVKELQARCADLKEENKRLHEMCLQRELDKAEHSGRSIKLRAKLNQAEAELRKIEDVLMTVRSSVRFDDLLGGIKKYFGE